MALALAFVLVFTLMPVGAVYADSPDSSPLSHTVLFDANGGAFAPAAPVSKTIGEGEAYGSLPAVFLAGYTFGGWYTERSGGTQITEDTIMTTDADHTLYAHWSYSSGWVKEGGVWKYYNTGTALTGWLKAGGFWYYANKSGIRLSGWQRIDGDWYYLGGADDGRMRTGWQKISGKWFYLGKAGAATTGKMQSGWLKFGGKWYHLGSASNGIMKTGWQKLGGYWYYFGDADGGAMSVGWQWINNYWYYFGGANDGKMRTGLQKVDGVMHYFGGPNDGRMDSGKRWAEVDLSDQIAYFYDGDMLMRTCVISSGAAAHKTQVGNFRVWAKVRKQDMSGPGYYTKNVEWITYFDGGIAFHYAYWHNSFGRPVSHGCINMKKDDAIFSYNFLQKGDKVVVHE
ncbi:MAG: L,D-transpeptidase family protein [Clostridiales Family XIII bacterium]|jgi:uncharacterized repeat protein (TIGR02543 family)|nr:L,D-transpeptidase family protein [Clostridiales Family XIII bacterium]